MSRRRVALIAVVALLTTVMPVLTLAQPSSAAACSSPSHKTWVGTSGSTWTDPLAWNPNGVPLAADDVCIDDSGPVVVDGAATAASIESSEPLKVSLGATLDVASTVESTVIDFEVLGAVNVAGSLSVGGSIAVSGALTASSVVLKDDAEMVMGAPTSKVTVDSGNGQLVIEQGASLRGSGTIEGSIDNAGIVSLSGPAESPLVVTLDFVSHADSLLAVAISGSAASGAYGHMQVQRSVTADGVVRVDVGGFVPAAGESYRAVESPVVSGTFDSVTSDSSEPIVFSGQLDQSGLLLTAAPNSGAVSGLVFEDVNGNGARDIDELPLGGVTVFVDYDDDASVDSDESPVVTNADGAFSFAAARVGESSLVAIAPRGWKVSTQDVSLDITPGSVVAGVEIGQFEMPEVSGRVFFDTDGNGVMNGSESGASGRTVFVDLDNNGRRGTGEPSTTTDASGVYRLEDVGPGLLRPRVALTGGHVLSTTLTSFGAVSGVDTSVDFGLYLFSSMSGVLFADSNSNGIRDAGEAPIGGRTVYVDRNDNGALDGIDVSARTSFNGAFLLTGLIGSQRLRVVANADEIQTPTSPLIVALSSGNTKTGVLVGLSRDIADVMPEVITRSDPLSDGTGYWMAAADGGVFSFGDADFHGSMGDVRLNAPVVGFDAISSGAGYQLVAADGGVFSFGDADFHGSMGGQHLNSPMVGIATTVSGDGYWTVAADGGVFSFGDADFHGSMGGQHLNAPIVGMLPTADGDGYWQVAADGGVFTFGAAQFHGSAVPYHGTHRIVGMARSGDDGYWIVDSEGGVYSFGSAQFFGSMGGERLNSPIVSIRSLEDGSGYWLFAADGGVFAYGSAKFFGRAPTPLRSAVIG